MPIKNDKPLIKEEVMRLLADTLSSGTFRAYSGSFPQTPDSKIEGDLLFEILPNGEVKDYRK